MINVNSNNDNNDNGRNSIVTFIKEPQRIKNKNLFYDLVMIPPFTTVYIAYRCTTYGLEMISDVFLR